MRSQFSLFNSHIDLAHTYWQSIITVGDVVIDATCGNGKDSLFLAQLPVSKIYAIDIQEKAIEATQQLLISNLPVEKSKNVEYILDSHESFPIEIKPSSIKLIVYNLGYLPGSNKETKTLASSTIKSLINALPLIKPGGLISITCYPGHPEGKIEENDIISFTSTLAPTQWSCCHHSWLNRNNAPSLLLLQKAIF